MTRATLPKFKIAVSLLLGFSTVFLGSACSNSLFKVKPVTALPPMPSSAASTNVGSVTFRAAPLLTDEETQELFESNLQLAGLLPVRLEVVHNGGDPLAIKKLKLRLRDVSGAEWKMISAKDAVSRILKANKIFLYNPNSRQTFEKELCAYEFDLKNPLSHEQGRRHGLVIFLAPQKQPVESSHDLVLSIEGLAQAVSLKLN